MAKVRGRPANPYTTDNPLWQPGYTKSGFFEFVNLMYKPPSVHQINELDGEEGEGHLPTEQGILAHEVEWYIYQLLLQAGIPLVRRFIESVFVFDHGLIPHDVTRGLTALREGTTDGLPTVYWKDVDMGHGEATDMYSIKPPTLAEERYLRKLYDLRRKYLNQKVLGNTGERFIRSALKHKGRYEGTTPKGHLGKIETTLGCLDILTTDTETGKHYGIEVRNRHEFLYPNNPWIEEVKDRALSIGRIPWLVCAYAKTGMEEECKEKGVRLTPIGFQVAPEKYPYGRKGRKIKKVLEELLPIHGPDKWYLYGVRYKRPREWPPRRDLKRGNT